ncbi:ATP-binding protein [Candidatus Poriferisocius sp.]|uniref:ATP-binding protein n=1 Tax=Candidatus Poriferisocius sp. TaxID=3101276 RepID=UPI003B02061A
MATRTELMGALFANLAADPSNMPSQTPVNSIAPSAMETLRGRLSDDDSPKAELPKRDLLGRLGLVAEDGEHLNKAGEMLLAVRREPAIDYSYRHVPGGPSILRILEGGRSLLEEVLAVEVRANDHNFVTEITIGLQVHKVWAIPRRSLREALLNAVCHREWSLPDPTVVEHIGNHFRVTSPGGLIGGITESNIITHHSVPRYRTLMNALRLIGLVEQEGVGVDMMFAEMIRIGSRPPAITTLPDPAVRIDLYGQTVNENWYRLFADLEPPGGRDDVDAALLVWRGAQPQSPFLTSESCAPLLQRSRGDAEAALRRVAEYRLATPGAPLLSPIAVPHDTPAAWQLSPQAKAALGLQPGTESGEWALAWARERGRISSGEYRELAGVSAATATNRLKEMARQGWLVPSSDVGRGRGFHYLPTR